MPAVKKHTDDVHFNTDSIDRDIDMISYDNEEENSEDDDYNEEKDENLGVKEEVEDDEGDERMREIKVAKDPEVKEICDGMELSSKKVEDTVGEKIGEHLIEDFQS